jgi:hypothetical protein
MEVKLHTFFTSNLRNGEQLKQNWVRVGEVWTCWKITNYMELTTNREATR